MNIREKFLKANIPYDDIDEEMIELIDILNFDLGLKTEFCCYGHEDGQKTFVVFDKSVQDSDIMALAEHLSKSKRETSACGIFLLNNFGEFNKCVCNIPMEGLIINWVYSFPEVSGQVKIYEGIKKAHMQRLLQDLREFKIKE